MSLANNIWNFISSFWKTSPIRASSPPFSIKLESLASLLEEMKDYHKYLEPLILYRQLCPYGPIAARRILLTRDNEDDEAVNHLEQWRLAKIEELRERYEKGQKEHFEEMYRQRKIRNLKTKLKKAQLLRRRSAIAR